uniref:TRI17 n=1 Tax=Trichoderma albolutescens TaxID=692677 RepID=A0A5B8ZTZ3_9HYPO|nr:TRI17 [Trichoderma albolutescens]
MSGTNPIPLAIVGIGCRFPGDATSPEKLWDLIANGKSAWCKVPSDRWIEEAFWHPDPDDTNGTNNQKGGHFITQDISEFDAGFFNVTPQEAAAMDPQQRFLIETTYEALESAGIRQEELKRSNAAVYMAMFTRDYDRNAFKDTLSIPKYHVTGTGDAIMANRISYLFDLNGPSVTIDTACSGGMVTIAHACQALRSGESDLALAGAVNMILTPDHIIGLSNLHMINDDGRSYAFDSRGAGYGRGEGVATLVIKRLDDAIKANDPIRAIIRDAAINQDGLTVGITLPSGDAQEVLEQKVWHHIGLDPQSVGYVEAHGTGTLVGDSAELEAISRVFCQDRDSPLIVGSIKSNIGHTECASGIAAIIKSVMIFEKDAIPPNVNFEQPRESLNLEQKKLKIPTSLQPWQQQGTARISINSFGYGGTNTHAILERYERSTPSEAKETKDVPRLFVFSAAKQVSLLNMLAVNREWVSNHGDETSLRDLAYTLTQRRSVFNWRFSCVAANQEELLEALSQGSKKKDAITRVSPGIKVSFVFTGQGAQWAGMGRELLSYPTFNNSIEKSRRILRDLGSSWDLVEELLRDKDSRLQEAELAQPATTAVQVALVDLAREWGIVPDSVIGHSSGEIGAAYTAGYLSHFQAIKVAYVRGFSAGISKSKGLGKGGMLAVGVGEYDVEPYLDMLTQGVAVVACQNSPSSTTISGDDAAITELSELLTQDSIFNRRLNVDTAYHSHHMQAAADEYRAGMGDILDDTSPETGIRMFSSVTGELKSEGFDTEYWTTNLVSKVRFCDALQALCESEQTSSRTSNRPHIFIEMGPHAALAGPARQCIADLIVPMQYNYLSALVRKSPAVQTALAMAGNVFNQGYPVNLAAVSGSDSTLKNASVLHSLPSYPWDHSKKHWHESRLSRDYRLRKHPYHDLFGLRMTDHTPLQPSWRHMVGLQGLPWLKDHVVDGLMVFPSSGYMVMAIEAASQLAGDRFPGKKINRICLKDVSLLKALAIPEEPARVEVQLSFNAVETFDNGKTMEHTFSITAFTGDDQWNEYSRGSVIVEFASDDNAAFGAQVTYGDLVDQLDVASAKRIQSSDLYQELEKVGNAYGPTFTGIEEMILGADLAMSRVAIPDVVSAMPARHMCSHIVHPSTLDILLHTTLPLVNQKLDAGSLIHIKSLAISPGIENAPGKLLSAITSLTSSQFRAAEVDLEVFPGDADKATTPVISVSGIELRSLNSGNLEDDSAQGGRDICYDMKWGVDEKYLSAKHIQPSQTLDSEDPLSHSYALMAQYLKHKAFKQAGLSVIELGGSTGSPALAFLEALQSYDSRPKAYHFTSKDELENVKKELQDWADVVNFRKLDVEEEELDTAFEQNSYDIVFACNNASVVSNTKVALSNAHKLLKPDGVLLLIADATEHPLPTKDALSQASLKLQFATEDSKSKFSFMVARAIGDITPSISEIKLISESSLPSSLKSLATELSNALGSNGLQVTVSSLDTKTQDNVIHVVIDDGSNPLLSEAGPEKFRQIVDLVQGSSKIVWISAQDNDQDIISPKKHLITGFARTAHAENDDLELVTIDVQQTLDQTTQGGISQFLTEVVRSFANGDSLREREYVYNGTDVLVPRLIPHAILNHQVSGKNETVVMTETFAGSQATLQLEAQEDPHAKPVFIESEALNEPLQGDYVEIEAKAFGVSSRPSQSGTTINEYAGLITATGSGVSGLEVGARVVALGAVSCANRIRVPAALVQSLPSQVSFTAAAALPLPFMTASYALVDIADIQPGQLVLVDGATSDVGQAALSIAKHLGAEVIAAVARIDEAAFLTDSFKIPSSHIVSRESHLGLRQIQKLVGSNGLDVILGCAQSSVAAEISQVLKPFGALVHIRSGGNESKHQASVQPSNATVSTFDLESLLKAKPHKTSQLLQQVIGMINKGLPFASHKVTVLPLDDLEEAFKLAQQGGMAKYVLEVQENSLVKVARPSYKLPKLEPDVTYVVAGGLGDLGQRLLHLMAKAGAKYLVTLSRKGAEADEFLKVEREVGEITQGCKLLAVKCDISQESSVRVALSEIKTKGFPAVSGVVQSAVILRDAALDTMTAEVFNTVLETKARGTLNLQKVFAPEGLTFFISFSSVMNVIGGKGQANYNAGNSLQDSLAQFDRTSGCFYMSLNIGAIEDAAVNNEAIIQSFRRQGLTRITNDELLAYFEYALSADAREAGCHQPVIGFTSETITGTTAVNGAAHTLMFTHVRRTTASEAEEDVEQIKTFKDIIKETTDKETISAFVAQTIGGKLADLIGSDAADIDLGSSMADYGLDSIIAIELRNWLMREFDASIQSSEVLDGPDIWALAQKVTSRSKMIAA